jgi:outer membrane protein assembly factor BamB
MRCNYASPVAFEDKIYVVSGVILKCADRSSGKVLWEKRLTQGRKQKRIWATPLVANGHLFVIDDAGDVTVIKVDSGGEVVSRPSLGETIMGSPAVHGNAMFVRSDKHLFKVGL